MADTEQSSNPVELGNPKVNAAGSVNPETGEPRQCVLPNGHEGDHENDDEGYASASWGLLKWFERTLPWRRKAGGSS